MGFRAHAMVKSLVSAKNQDHLSTENSQHGSGETVHCESDGSKIKKKIGEYVQHPSSRINALLSAV